MLSNFHHKHFPDKSNIMGVEYMALDYQRPANIVTVNLILTKVNLKGDFSHVKFVTAILLKHSC